jgi:amino acid transporter
MTTTVTPATRTDAHRRLGVGAIAMMIIAASAPLTVVAGGATSAFSVTQVLGIPFGYIVLAAVLGIFALGYAAMSRHITNAGAFYAYISQGIGRPFGVGSSIIALVSYNAMQIGIYGMFGFQVSTFVQAKTGWATPWWLWVLICIVIIGLMGVNRVDLSVKVVGVLVILEFLVVIIFDFVAFANPAEGFSTAPVTPTALIVPGVGAALAFGIAAFMGFESAAIYSEESRDPKRTIPRATFLAVAVIGVFYAISSWALALVIGPNTLAAGISPEEAGPPLFFNFVATQLGVIWVDIMSILFITSLFAALISFHNAVARYAFSLGREGVLPKRLSAIRAESGAPWAGSVFQTLIAVVIIVAFAIGESGWDPNTGPYPVLTLFTWLTNLGAFGLVLLMVLVSLAVIGFFRRDPRDVGIGSRLVAPIIATIALGTVWVLILMNWDVLLGQTESTPTTFILPTVALLPALIAGLWSLRLRHTRPDVYRQIGHGADNANSPRLGD